MFLNKIKYDINFIQNQFFIMNQTLYKLFSPKYFDDGAISLSYGSNDQLFGSFN